MPRFEDTPSLFGVGSGVGTCANVLCDWCGELYDNREDENEEPYDIHDTISIDQFGDKQICDCCFYDVEKAVLSNMVRILPWFMRIIEDRKKRTKELDDLISKIVEAIMSIRIGDE